MDVALVDRSEPPPRAATNAARSPQRRRPVVACAALLAAFAMLTVAVKEGWTGPLDIDVMTWAARSQWPLAHTAAQVLTTLVTPQFLVPITIVVTTWRGWAQPELGRGFAVHAATRAGLLTVSVLGLKTLTGRSGPALHSSFLNVPLGSIDRIVGGGGGMAFPSGHTTTTVVCAALILNSLRWPAPMHWRVLAVVTVVALVSASLVYLNFHWLTDVVGGWLLGAAVLVVPLPRKARSTGSRAANQIFVSRGKAGPQMPASLDAPAPSGTQLSAARRLSAGYRRQATGVIATIATLLGVLAIIDAIVPEQRDHIHDLTRLLPLPAGAAAASVTALSGLLLLRVAAALRKRKRRAWRLAVGATMAMAVTFAVRGHHPGGLVVSLILLGLLWSARRSFTARSDPTTRWFALRVFLWSLAAGLVYGLGALYFSHRVVGTPSFSSRLQTSNTTATPSMTSTNTMAARLGALPRRSTTDPGPRQAWTPTTDTALRPRRSARRARRDRRPSGCSAEGGAGC